MGKGTSERTDGGGSPPGIRLSVNGASERTGGTSGRGGRRRLGAGGLRVPGAAGSPEGRPGWSAISLPRGSPNGCLPGQDAACASSTFSSRKSEVWEALLSVVVRVPQKGGGMRFIVMNQISHDPAAAPATGGRAAPTAAKAPKAARTATAGKPCPARRAEVLTA
ncbi:hypothetical protein GCM10018953_34380 [Streptosporangium nondiastaticum]